MKIPNTPKPSEPVIDPADLDLPPTRPIDITSLLENSPEKG